MDSTIAFSRDALRGLMARLADAPRAPEAFRVIDDTTDFHRLESGDVLILGGSPFWLRGFEREGRFGMDDEPKYWVRRALDLTDGSTKVIKLEFREEFETRIGELVVRRFRSPRKEGRILDLVRDQPNFMHGRWVRDAAGNNVRILDFIRGRRYDEIVAATGADHRDYFHRHFPGVLEQYVELVRAIKYLHDRGEKHGDIRRDHIIFDRERAVNRWIDFDYDYVHGESLFSFDLQGLGNVLIFLVGRGDVLLPELRRERPALLDALTPEDLNISFRNRVANLQKIFPYVPDSLNRILLHFSAGAPLFYDAVDQLLEDLAAAASDVGARPGGAL
jgi:hypothetical protein